MSLQRKLDRTRIKQQQGNNKIQNAWRQYQLTKYGANQYRTILKNNNVLKGN